MSKVHPGWNRCQSVCSSTVCVSILVVCKSTSIWSRRSTMVLGTTYVCLRLLLRKTLRNW
ncbi:hypothetical protein KC19_3G264300 [Ceratodon purpureus]|uniref:Uncharacterized protein n=1 Tax=Ceratodon purpureus TaxID=3225 RepID=A0A8T0IQ86_CERPU|nr:hypothetical protein KC19_3G264300 [Ceratodon purpureus]